MGHRLAASLDTLASLGPVLALERIGDTDCCCRWFTRACRQACVGTRVSLEQGPHEELVALDAAGRACARLVRLPDSDYYAWSRAIERFGSHAGDACDGVRDAPPILRSVRPRWRGRVVRLERHGEAMLVARPLAHASIATARALLALAAAHGLELEA